MALRVLGISGSLRAASLNSGLLRAVAKALPGVQYELANIDVPLFNEDHEKKSIETDKRLIAFRAALLASDAVLIATPCYNGSVSGVLKNAIDWASRGGADMPASQQYPLKGKFVGLISSAGAGTKASKAVVTASLRQMGNVIMPDEVASLEYNHFKQQNIYDRATGNVTDPSVQQAAAAYAKAFLAFVAAQRAAARP